MENYYPEFSYPVYPAWMESALSGGITRQVLDKNPEYYTVLAVSGLRVLARVLDNALDAAEIPADYVQIAEKQLDQIKTAVDTWEQVLDGLLV